MKADTIKVDVLVELLTAWYIVHGGRRGSDARQRAEHDASMIRVTIRARKSRDERTAL